MIYYAQKEDLDLNKCAVGYSLKKYLLSVDIRSTLPPLPLTLSQNFKPARRMTSLT